MEAMDYQNKKTGRVRRGIIAAAAVAAVMVMSVTAYAAYENGWFGFDRVFGEKAELVAENVVTYDPAAEEFGAVEVTQPSYTAEEQAMIDEGTMTVPEQAALSGEGVTASTGDYTFTLEELLASEDTLFAIVRMEAQNETARSDLAQSYEAGTFDGPFLTALNWSGEGHEREAKNGGLSFDALTMEEDSVYFLLRNSGGQFAVGDQILFQYRVESDCVDLFKVPLEKQMEEAVITLDTSAYTGMDYQWDSIAITPISLTAHGTVLVSPDRSDPEITIYYKDGSNVSLPTWRNEFQPNDYAVFGGGSSDGFWIRQAWYFKQAIDLSEIDHITVDGVDYQLDTTE